MSNSLNEAIDLIFRPYDPIPAGDWLAYLESLVELSELAGRWHLRLLLRLHP